MLKRFGLTMDDYDLLMLSQGGVCYICLKAPVKVSLNVDHDHSTGRIRGLLCHLHNRALGLFADKNQLERAAEYWNRDTGYVAPPKQRKKRKK